MESNKNDCFKILQLDILKAIFNYDSHINNKFISDRSVLSPIVYSHFYFGEEYGNLLEEKEEFINSLNFYKNNSLIVLLTPNEKFLKSDGTRKEALIEDLYKITSLYKNIFSKYNLNYIVLDNFNERELILENLIEESWFK